MMRNREIISLDLFLSSFIWLDLTFPALPPFSHLAHFLIFCHRDHRGHREKKFLTSVFSVSSVAK
jgi:hypothetical protein